MDCAVWLFEVVVLSSVLCYYCGLDVDAILVCLGSLFV